MIRAALLSLAALPANADVLICGFEPVDCPTDLLCDPFEITIDTHHGSDAPVFDYGGHSVPIRAIPGGSVDAPSFVTLGHADREIITLFNGFDAVHTRHFSINGQVTSHTTHGRCTSFF